MPIRNVAGRLPTSVTAPLLFAGTTLLYVGLWHLSGGPVTDFTWATGALIAANAAYVDARRRRAVRAGVPA
jgi:hypothetical protein